MLKYEEKTIRTIDYNDLDRFLSEELGVQWECVPIEEWGNYQSHPIDIEPEELDEYSKEQLDNFILHEKWPSFITGDVLNHLCFQGKVWPGQYYIDIFW